MTDMHTAIRSGDHFYPDELQTREWWVDWVLAHRYAKQPIAPYWTHTAKPVKWNFGLSDEDHPSTDYATVHEWEGAEIGTDLSAPKRVQSDTVGIGIIIPPNQDGQTITLLDWDDVRDPDTGEIHPVAADALEAADCYAEVSQSGKGIHQFVFGEIPGGLKKFIRHVDDEPFVGDDRPQIEMYQSGRLCAMTGEHVRGSGRNVSEEQDLIDRLCWEYGTGENKSTDTPTDPFARTQDRDYTDATGETPTHEDVANAIRKEREYDGDDPSTWDIPEGESTEYHAVLKARRRSDEFPNISNWELIGYAAALGYDDGLDKSEILADLKQNPTPQYGYDGDRARKEVRGVIRKVENGNYKQPTWHGLAKRGILPERDGVSDDDIETYAHVIDRRRSFETIEDLELPQHHSYVMIKPPRAGGSYAIQRDFMAQGPPFMVLAPRHSILKYHVETLDDLAGDNDYSIVHVKGKSHLCDSPHGRCDKVPDGPEQYQSFRTEIRNIVHENRVLTPDDAPTGVCKHWFMMNAAEFADIVLTVPQIAQRIDRDREEMRLFVDEEQTFAPFHPGAVDLVSLATRTESDETTTVQLLEAGILSHLETLREIRERIHDEQQERAEDGDTDEFHETETEAAILEAIDTAEELAGALGVGATKRSLLRAGKDVTLQATLEELRAGLEDVSLPDVEVGPDKLKEAIEEYAMPYYWSDETDPDAILTALLFPYDENPFHWKSVGGEATCRLIGDKRQIFYGGWFADFKQVAAIAGPGGERFLTDVRDDMVAVELERFTYDEHFVVIPIGKRKDGEMEPVDSSRDRVLRTAKALNDRPHPFMAVAGTKQQAYDIDKRLTNHGSNVVEDPDSPATELYRLWANSESAIIFENSIVSRGIDAPDFDVTLICNPGFATPYWEARADHYDRDTDEWMEAKAVEQQLKDRELTNAALRMSHTYTTEDNYGTKFILAAAGDVNRLLYLQDRVAPKVTYADQAAELLSVLTARGAYEGELSDVKSGLGGSEKAFTDIATTERFTERPTNRPEYAFAEIKEWIDSAYLNHDIVARVRDALVRCGGEATTTEIVEKCPGVNAGRVKGVLSVLERHGKTFSSQAAPSGRGRPATQWELTET